MSSLVALPRKEVAGVKHSRSMRARERQMTRYGRHGVAQALQRRDGGEVVMPVRCGINSVRVVAVQQHAKCRAEKK